MKYKSSTRILTYKSTPEGSSKWFPSSTALPSQITVLFPGLCFCGELDQEMAALDTATPAQTHQQPTAGFELRKILLEELNSVSWFEGFSL